MLIQHQKGRKTMPGPYDSGNGNRGGGASIGPDGIHYTDYNNGSHNSWNENHGNVSDIHSTNHDPRRINDNPADNRGNPYGR